jgi:PAS domain-containing protein
MGSDSVTLSPGPALRLVAGAGAHERPAEWAWFCGHCAAPSPSGTAPAPTARVCPACGLGLLLETPREVVPSSREAYVVIDGGLLVHAVSRRAEKLLGIREDSAFRRPLSELLVAAEADEHVGADLAGAVLAAVAGSDDTRRVHVRPTNTYGVHLRARVAPCGPPRAALLVLDGPQPVAPRDRAGR